MVVVREVSLQPCDEWIQLKISHRVSGRPQVIQAEEAPSLGSAVALDDSGGYFLVWRVCGYEKQQCLELEELHSEVDAASGRIRVFLDEQIVDVKCLARDGYVVLMIFTLTSVHFAQVALFQDPTLLQALFPVASAGGLQRGGAPERPSENTSGRSGLACSWSKLPAWSQVHEAKEGQSVLCCDARFAEKSDEIEVFLGTNGGVTLVLSISDQGKVTTKCELRQTSGGFSLFRSPAKTLAGGQRVTCIVVDGEDKVLTLSEDGKVKRWNTRTSKCLAERSITVDKDLSTGRVSTLCAFKMCVMPEQRKVIFALRADDAHGANELVECDLEKITDLRPKDGLLNNLLLMVEDSLRMLEESSQVVELKAMGPAMIGEDNQQREVLVSGWQGVSASVTVMTRLDEQVTERVFSQCADLQSQVELAALYLEKWRAGSAGAEGAPEPLQLIQEIIFRPHRFSSAVLHSSMHKLVVKYRGQAPQLRTWPGPLEKEHTMHDFIRRTIDEVAQGTRVPALDVWHTLLAMCEHHWRSDCDGLLGVIGLDLNISSCLLVKQRGTSVLRLATGSEHDFHRLMLHAETDDHHDSLHLDGPDSCLLLAYKTLVWMESDDPGGAVFSQRMMSQDAELVVDNMLRELMVSSCEPSVDLDPEKLLQDHPQMLLDSNWTQSDSSLCRSFDQHLVALETSTAPERRATGQESTWMKLYKQQVCEQLVKTHYEVVRGLSLALALVDYHHKATGDDELDDVSYERVRSKLRDILLPLLSSYHVLRWSAGRMLPAGAQLVQGGLLSQLSRNVNKTLLSLCVEDTDPADLQTVAEFVKNPVRFICNPLGQGSGEEGLIWKTFKVLRRENVEDDVSAAQWNDLLGLCQHPTTTRAGSCDSGDMMSDSASSSWWYHTVLVPFVRGYSCIHMSRWKEATQHFSTVLRGSRRLIAGGDVAAVRVLVSEHPLLMLQEELAYQAHDSTPSSQFNDYLTRREQLRNSMRTLTMASRWGPSINNLLEYFLLLHDYLGSKGLIQSIRELILARIQLMRPARAGLPGQHSGIDGNAHGGIEGAIESFCALMHLATESLRDLEARLDGIEQHYHLERYPDAECVFAIDCLRYLIAASQHYLRVSWLSMYTDCGMFDEAYDLVAEPIALCNDDDISKMREVLQEGGDEYRDVERWLDNYSAMDVDTYNSQPKAGGLEWAVSQKSIQDKLHLRSRKEAYRCLEGFVSAPGLQSQPDKLCSYPWVNCSHTVDTLLRERCEHLQETTSNNQNLQDSYNVRYAFNIARSDYRTAGDTMMTYCFNLVTANMHAPAGVPESGERLVDLNVLQQQAYFSLAAINCYSLIDERFAFWILPQPAALAPKKRQASTRDGIDMAAETVTGDSTRAPDVITLPVMLQHYALLRARIRLAEWYSLASGEAQMPGMMQVHERTARHRMVSFSTSQQQAMAEDTVQEMLKVGLLDDAISLAAAFCTSTSSSSPISAPGSLAIEDFCRAVTEVEILKSRLPCHFI